MCKELLEPNGIVCTGPIFAKLFSKRHIVLLSIKTLFVIEFRLHKTVSYIYEKLQTCDFKNRQYNKLLAPLGIKVKYVYILNDWFRKPEYEDVLTYVESVGCHYFFHELPLDFLGLPSPKK